VPLSIQSFPRSEEHIIPGFLQAMMIDSLLNDLFLWFRLVSQIAGSLTTATKPRQVQVGLRGEGDDYLPAHAAILALTWSMGMPWLRSNAASPSATACRNSSS
jgi:hypothetical protein